VRAFARARMAGLKLDKNRNEQAVGKEAQISTDGSNLKAFVIPTDEELLIARDMCVALPVNHTPRKRCGEAS